MYQGRSSITDANFKKIRRNKSIYKIHFTLSVISLLADLTNQKYVERLECDKIASKSEFRGFHVIFLRV